MAGWLDGWIDGWMLHHCQVRKNITKKSREQNTITCAATTLTHCILLTAIIS